MIGLVQNPRFVGRNAGKNGSNFVHSTASIKRKETDHSVVLNQRHSAVKLTRSVIRFIHPILLDTTVESSVFYIQFTVSSADHQIGIILSDIRSAIARNWHRFVLSQSYRQHCSVLQTKFLIRSLQRYIKHYNSHVSCAPSYNGAIGWFRQVYRVVIDTLKIRSKGHILVNLY